MNSPVTLFCIPYAGGTRQAFNQFLPCFPGYKVVVLELPGKGTRFSEPPLEDLNRIVEDVYGQVLQEKPENYCFWGHSMGALLAFLVTKRLAEENLPLPGHLFLSGRPAPTAARKTLKHLLPREEFFEMLIGMGGIPKEIVADRDLLEFFEGIIRSDFKAVETFDYISGSRINVPMTVMIGSEEEFSREEAEKWREETTAHCEIMEFQGGHFFIYDHIENVADQIRNRGLLSVTGK